MGGLAYCVVFLDTLVGLVKVGMMRRSRNRINMLSAACDDDRTVVAYRMAAQFSMKSTTAAAGVYGWKKDCRDCRTDHSNTVTWESDQR